MIENRRPISSRSTGWANKIAQFLSQKSITPNQISIASIGFSLLGMISLIYLKNYYGFILCIIFIQARLLCNLFDGMVAIEGGKKTLSGPLFNEFPDRFADTFFFLGLGYAINFPELGWIAAILSLGTAYVRVFSSSLDIPQSFIGPMAKQHRMATLSIGCLLGQFEWIYYSSYNALFLTIMVIIIGCILTCYNRSIYILSSLASKEAKNDNV